MLGFKNVQLSIDVIFSHQALKKINMAARGKFETPNELKGNVQHSAPTVGTNSFLARIPFIEIG